MKVLPTGQSHDNARDDEFMKRGQELLRQHGYKLTPQREVILRLFCECYEHLTPQTVFQMLEGSVRRLSLATVYNTLEIFTDVGVLSRICAENGQTYFDPNPTSHHHAVCRDCGSIMDIDVPEDALTRFLEAIQMSQNNGLSQPLFSVADATIWFNGNCEQCCAQQSAKN